MDKVQKMGNALMAAGGVTAFFFLLVLILRFDIVSSGSNMTYIVGSGLAFGMAAFTSGMVSVVVPRRHPAPAEGVIPCRTEIRKELNRFTVSSGDNGGQSIYEYDLEKDRYEEDTRVERVRTGTEHVLDLSHAKAVYLNDDRQLPVYSRDTSSGRDVYSGGDGTNGETGHYEDDMSQWYGSVYEGLFR